MTGIFFQKLGGALLLGFLSNWRDLAVRTYMYKTKKLQGE